MKPQTDRRKPNLRNIAELERTAGAKRARLPAFIRPQLATLVSEVPPEDHWLHEVKFDGYRIICRVQDGRASLLTREAQDWTGRFKSLAKATSELPVREALFDGEVVALEKSGGGNFQLLQNSLSGNSAANLIYYVFDLLYLNGVDLSRSPLLTRKQILAKIIAPKGWSGKLSVRYSEHWIGRGAELYQEACRLSFEGVVSKRADQPYRPGRGRDWLKIKCLQSQEFVIGGFTEPAGSRVGLGALLLGVHDDHAELRYAGRVGTGFTSQTLKELRARLATLKRKSPAFANPPTGRDAKNVHWIEPALVGEVAFTGWTRDALLRHPSFKGLREDKPAGEIKREVAARPAHNHSGGSEAIAGITLTHPDRVLYPEQGITKRELALYYEAVGDWIMPHVENRLLTLLRCPEGRGKQCFIQRHAHNSLAESVRRITVKEAGSVKSYLAVDSLTGLIALVQMGVLELHTWGSRADRIEQPDRIIFDLDPDPALPWEPLHEAAETLHARLSDLGLNSFVKTTGGKGLHVVVPIVPKQDWESIREFSRLVAQSIVREDPARYTATMSKVKRKGKIFIDYPRNARAATAVCAYSTRARPRAPVSVPLRWEELNTDVRSDHFTIRNVPQRLERLRRDPWQDYESARRPVTRALMKKL